MTLVPLCLYAIPRQCRQAIIKCSCSERQFKVIIGVASLATKSAFSHCQWLVFMSFISCEAVPHNEVKSFHLTSDLYFLVLVFSRDIDEILRSISQETSCERQEHRNKNDPSKLISSHCASMCNIWNFTHTCQKRQGYIFFFVSGYYFLVAQASLVLKCLTKALQRGNLCYATSIHNNIFQLKTVGDIESSCFCLLFRMSCMEIAGLFLLETLSFELQVRFSVRKLLA